jgi:hypothetical protein
MLRNPATAEGTFTHLEVTGKLGGEGLGEISDGRVEVEDSGVLQALRLVDNCLDHIRVAVAAAHRRDPPKGIQISTPLLVEQVLPLSIHHVQLHNTKSRTIDRESQRCTVKWESY